VKSAIKPESTFSIVTYLQDRKIASVFGNVCLNTSSSSGMLAQHAQRKRQPLADDDMRNSPMRTIRVWETGASRPFFSIWKKS
jgi:hypothetical protein